MNNRYHKRLRDLREDHDLSQEAVGRILGITKQQYFLYEKGYRELPVAAAIALAKFYEVSLDYLLGVSDETSHLK